MSDCIQWQPEFNWKVFVVDRIRVRISIQYIPIPRQYEGKKWIVFFEKCSSTATDRIVIVLQQYTDAIAVYSLNTIQNTINKLPLIIYEFKAKLEIYAIL